MNRRDWFRMAAFAALGARADAAVEAPDLEIAREDWGSSSREDILAVLGSVREVFREHLRDLRTPPIVVVRSRENPITYNRRDERNRVRVALNSQDNLWAQFSYQFAHEWVHVLAGHTGDPPRWESTDNRVGWLEESLCECGSLFALRAMSAAWKTRPPYPNWVDYSAALADYARRRLEDPAHRLPEGLTLADWVRDQRRHLEAGCCDRVRNSVVACQLLPQFENDPQGWGALASFRQSREGPQASLEAHLAGWAAASPEALRPFVRKLARSLTGRLYD